MRDDFEVPVRVLQQKVEALEEKLSHLQGSMVEKLTEAVASNFNTKMHTYLPKVANLLDDYRLFKEKVELRQSKEAADEEETNAAGPVAETRIKALEFLVNNNKAEVDFLKKTFTP